MSLAVVSATRPSSSQAAARKSALAGPPTTAKWAPAVTRLSWDHRMALLAAFHATIGGYSTGDEFDLGGFAFGAGETRSFTENSGNTGGTLSIVDGSKTASLWLLGSYHTTDFALSTDSHGGAFVNHAMPRSLSIPSK